MRPCGAEMVGVAGRRFVRRTAGRRRGIRGPGPPLPDLSVVDEVRVDLAGDVALEDAHDLAGGASFGEAAGDVFAGAFVAAHAGEHDPPECMVGLAVPAGVEAMPGGLARRCGQGCDTAEVRERGFVAEPVRVVTGRDEQDRRGAGPDAVDVAEARVAAVDECRRGADRVGRCRLRARGRVDRGFGSRVSWRR